MAIDQPTTDALNSALRSMQAASTELTQLLGGRVPSADKRIEILQKNFEQLSHYDRHYSTTRSALTTLLVTVGLVVAREPLLSLWGNKACIATDLWSLVTYISRNFAVTILLFFLAFPVNFYFRRLTLACNLIEHTIAREIGEIMGLPGVPAASARIQRVRGAQVHGYYFTDDLRRVTTSLGWPWPDAMTNLLLFAELEFLAILVLICMSQCPYWTDYYCLGLVVPPAISLLLAYRPRRAASDSPAGP